MIIAISNRKGGSAKSTTTIHVGAGLARLGKRVLLVDMDDQSHLAVGFGVEPAAITHDISEVLMRKVRLQDTIIPIEERLDLVPSSDDLAYIEIGLNNAPRREDRLKLALAPVLPQYDFILIDCPPSLGIFTVNAYSAADAVLIPVSVEFNAIDGLGKLLATLDDVRRDINPDIQTLGILPTRMHSHHRNDRELLDQLYTEINGSVPIYKEAIPERVGFREASALGKTIYDHNPESAGAHAYMTLCKEVASHAR